MRYLYKIVQCFILIHHPIPFLHTFKPTARSKNVLLHNHDDNAS